MVVVQHALVWEAPLPVTMLLNMISAHSLVTDFSCHFYFVCRWPMVYLNHQSYYHSVIWFYIFVDSTDKHTISFKFSDLILFASLWLLSLFWTLHSKSTKEIEVIFHNLTNFTVKIALIQAPIRWVVYNHLLENS
jgi:hypothetical protein